MCVILPSRKQKSLQLAFLVRHMWAHSVHKTVDMRVMCFGGAPICVCCMTLGTRSLCGAKTRDLFVLEINEYQIRVLIYTERIFEFGLIDCDAV